MNTEDYSRFIFIGFEDLKNIKFDKLEQVCDKVFVFVNRAEKAIPFVLVQQLQKLGENVQWIPITGDTTKSFFHFLSFHLGQVHEQVEEEVEFAIISEDASLDGLISFLNEKGRNAVRVTGNIVQTEHTSDLNGMNWSKMDEIEEELEMDDKDLEEKEIAAHQIMDRTNGEKRIDKPNSSAISPQSKQLSERIARETIKRLVMSGNRPAAIDALKSYILLQYNNADVNRNIDLIIRKLERTKEIEVKDKEVLYNF